MKILKNTSAVFVLAVLLTACAQVTLLKPGTATIGDTFTVETVSAWNKFPPANGIESWTLDGPGLQTLSFSTNIEEGENILRRTGEESGPNAKYNNMPTFKKGMNALEVSEMFVATFQQLGFADSKVNNLRNTGFGGREGFSFELDFADEEGLEKKTLVYGTTQGNVMHVIFFTAAKLHYFDRDRARVERIAESVRFKGSAGS